MNLKWCLINFDQYSFTISPKFNLSWLEPSRSEKRPHSPITFYGRMWEKNTSNSLSCRPHSDLTKWPSLWLRWPNRATSKTYHVLFINKIVDEEKIRPPIPATLLDHGQDFHVPDRTISDVRKQECGEPNGEQIGRVESVETKYNSENLQCLSED